MTVADITDQGRFGPIKLTVLQLADPFYSEFFHSGV